MTSTQPAVPLRMAGRFVIEPRSFSIVCKIGTEEGAVFTSVEKVKKHEVYQRPLYSPAAAAAASLTAMIVVAALPVLASKPDSRKGEGDWGFDGVKLANVDGVGSGYGMINNESNAELTDLIVVVGEIKGNATIIYDTERLDCPLKPGENWYWHLRENDNGYQVLRIYANGHETTPLPVVDHNPSR